MPQTLPRTVLASLVLPVIRLLQFVHVPLSRSASTLRRTWRHLSVFHYKLVYEGSPDDLFVVTYPKSGTTWLQMIVYQITTDGAMDFAHIDEVSPHLEETLVPSGRKISDLQGTPRVVKSHLSYRGIPKGAGRYIYGIRNGLDVAVSYHHHHRKYIPGRNRQPLDAFFYQFLAGDVVYGSWFEHVSDWLRNADRLNVLVVSYEELSADLEAGVRRIADFCGITIDPAAMPRILERCSFAFMREHEAKFSLEGRAVGSPGAATRFIRQGKVGGWKQVLDAPIVSEFLEACHRRLRDVGDDTFRTLSGQVAGPRGPAR